MVLKFILRPSGGTEISNFWDLLRDSPNLYCKIYVQNFLNTNACLRIPIVSISNFNFHFRLAVHARQTVFGSEFSGILSSSLYQKTKNNPPKHLKINMQYPLFALTECGKLRTSLRTFESRITGNFFQK